MLPLYSERSLFYIYGFDIEKKDSFKNHRWGQFNLYKKKKKKIINTRLFQNVYI